MKAIAVPELKTLVECINLMLADGYTEDFVIVNEQLTSLITGKKYLPSQIKIANYFRFEGQSNPEDNSILYAIITSDGTKGMLVDAYGPYADAGITNFIHEVENIQKITANR